MTDTNAARLFNMLLTRLYRTVPGAVIWAEYGYAKRWSQAHYGKIDPTDRLEIRKMVELSNNHPFVG